MGVCVFLKIISDLYRKKREHKTYLKEKKKPRPQFHAEITASIIWGFLFHPLGVGTHIYTVAVALKSIAPPPPFYLLFVLRQGFFMSPWLCLNSLFRPGWP